MNRAQRRKMARKRAVKAVETPFDQESVYRLRYDVSIPGGHLRSPHPVRVAGTVEATSETGLLRDILVRLLDIYGFVAHDRAVVGAIGETLNALPKRLRGEVANALITGLGLSVLTDEAEACDSCGAIKEQRVHPDPPEDTPEDALPLMLDVTEHRPECRIYRDNGPVTYRRETVVNIFTPRYFEPLIPVADPGKEVPETGGESLSTVDADDVSVVEEDKDDGAARESAAPEAAKDE